MQEQAGGVFNNNQPAWHLHRQPFKAFSDFCRKIKYTKALVTWRSGEVDICRSLWNLLTCGVPQSEYHELVICSWLCHVTFKHWWWMDCLKSVSSEVYNHFRKLRIIFWALRWLNWMLCSDFFNFLSIFISSVRSVCQGLKVLLSEALTTAETI